MNNNHQHPSPQLLQSLDRRFVELRDLCNGLDTVAALFLDRPDLARAFTQGALLVVDRTRETVYVVRPSKELHNALDELQKFTDVMFHQTMKMLELIEPSDLLDGDEGDKDDEQDRLDEEKGPENV